MLSFESLDPAMPDISLGLLCDMVSPSGLGNV